MESSEQVRHLVRDIEKLKSVVHAYREAVGAPDQARPGQFLPQPLVDFERAAVYVRPKGGKEWEDALLKMQLAMGLYED